MDTDLVVYDMDGTLADTSPGIISSFMYTAQALEVPEPSIETLYMNMGGSLIDNMARIYGVDHDSAMRLPGYTANTTVGRGISRRNSSQAWRSPCVRYVAGAYRSV